MEALAQIAASAEFEAFPKIVRYVNEVFTITEKIDGTNAAFRIAEGKVVSVQSRKRLITPDDDNFGFAAWVMGNEGEIVSEFGDGLHYGEWWGVGIQRNYGLTHRRFSPFNTFRWPDDRPYVNIGEVPVRGVPILVEGPLALLDVALGVTLEALSESGSVAAPGFTNPEGCMVFLHGLRKHLKAPFDPNPKGAE